MPPCSKSWSITVPASWEFRALAATCGGCMKPRRQTPMHDLPSQMFCYSVRKQVAAMIAALDGVDLLVFTGGIGENDVEARAAICGGLSWLGVSLDEARNRSANNPINDSRSRCVGAGPRLAGRRADRSPYLGIVPMEWLRISSPLLIGFFSAQTCGPSSMLFLIRWVGFWHQQAQQQHSSQGHRGDAQKARRAAKAPGHEA